MEDSSVQTVAEWTVISLLKHILPVVADYELDKGNVGLLRYTCFRVRRPKTKA